MRNSFWKHGLSDRWVRDTEVAFAYRIGHAQPRYPPLIAHVGHRVTFVALRRIRACGRSRFTLTGEQGADSLGGAYWQPFENWFAASRR